MTADMEDEYIVAQANEPLDENGRFLHTKVNARSRDEFVEVERERADFMDVSPRMVVSVATAMIPFLENDDANRALMGSNMQRQAVPLLKTESPIVGTGMEYKAGVDSGVCVLAKAAGLWSLVPIGEAQRDNTTGNRFLSHYQVYALQPGNMYQSGSGGVRRATVSRKHATFCRRAGDLQRRDQPG